jgi:hypothetical protein
VRLRTDDTVSQAHEGIGVVVGNALEVDLQRSSGGVRCLDSATVMGSRSVEAGRTARSPYEGLFGGLGPHRAQLADILLRH